MRIKIPDIEDYGYTFQFTLLKSNRTTPISLTGYEVHLKIDDLGLDKTLTIIDEANGICAYSLEESDFTERGKEYETKIYLYKDGEEHKTVAEFTFVTD